MEGVGSRVYGLRFRVKGLGLGFKVEGLDHVTTPGRVVLQASATVLFRISPAPPPRGN